MNLYLLENTNYEPYDKEIYHDMLVIAKTKKEAIIESNFSSGFFIPIEEIEKNTDKEYIKENFIAVKNKNDEIFCYKKIFDDQQDWDRKPKISLITKKIKKSFLEQIKNKYSNGYGIVISSNYLGY
jgi:hypothetical protein